MFSKLMDLLPRGVRHGAPGQASLPMDNTISRVVTDSFRVSRRQHGVSLRLLQLQPPGGVREMLVHESARLRCIAIDDGLQDGCMLVPHLPQASR